MMFNEKKIKELKFDIESLEDRVLNLEIRDMLRDCKDDSIDIGERVRIMKAIVVKSNHYRVDENVSKDGVEYVLMTYRRCSFKEILRISIPVNKKGKKK